MAELEHREPNGNLRLRDLFSRHYRKRYVLATLLTALVSYITLGDHHFVMDVLHGAAHHEGAFELEHTMMLQIALLGLYLTFGYVLGGILGRFKLPFYMGFLASGMFLAHAMRGTEFIQNLRHPEFHMHPLASFVYIASFIAIINVATILGVELEEEKLRKAGIKGALGAFLGILAPIIGVPLALHAIAPEIGFEVLVFVALVSAATSVTIKQLLFSQLNLMTTQFAATIFLMAVFDDVMTAIALSVGESVVTGAEPLVIIGTAALTMAVSTILMGLVLMQGYWLGDIGVWFASKVNLNSDVAMALLIAIYGFTGAAFSTMLGLTFVLGAFLAGTIIEEKTMNKVLGTHDTHASVQELAGVKDLNLAILFTLVGILIPLDSFSDPRIWVWGTVITLVAVAGKMIIGLVYWRSTGGNGFTARERVTLCTLLGLSMTGRFDVGSIIALLALSLGVFDPFFFTLAMFMVLGTTVFASWALNIVLPLNRELVGRFEG